MASAHQRAVDVVRCEWSFICARATFCCYLYVAAIRSSYFGCRRRARCLLISARRTNGRRAQAKVQGMSPARALTSAYLASVGDTEPLPECKPWVGSEGSPLGQTVLQGCWCAARGFRERAIVIEPSAQPPDWLWRARLEPV